MVNMQADKAGAMTLIGLMEYLKNNEGNSKVTCYIALAENMINENSYRPGDILTMKNGKTVKINNTDAEGRLVLFDNICLAQEQNKSFTSMTSIATLTGSAVVQFGNEAAGLVSFNNKLKRKIQKAGNKQGEIFLDAPFHKYMLDGVKDDIADLSNTGTPTMGCQKAGLFLTEAVKKKNKNKFIHIDIAGPAFVDKGFGSNPKGATGFGVRTLIELVK
jgi:leucyl aminopeptidase